MVAKTKLPRTSLVELAARFASLSLKAQSTIANSDALPEIYKLVKKAAGPIVLAYDTNTKHTATHLAEELNVRYKSGASMHRSDRAQVPAVAIPRDAAPQFPSSARLDLLCENNHLQLSSHEHRFSLELPPDHSLGLCVSRVVLHAVCEWFEPEMQTRFSDDARSPFSEAFDSCSSLLKMVAADQRAESFLDDALAILRKTILSKGFIYMFGNGGSACDALEIAQQGVSDGLPTTDLLDAGFLTCAYNDGFKVFERGIEALDSRHCVFAFTTSGESGNVNAALRHAKKISLPAIALTGKDGGALHTESLATCYYIVPSCETQRIQEIHALMASELFCRLSSTHECNTAPPL